MSEDDKKLDVSSSDFDPLLALYSEQVTLPCPDAPVKDNLSRFEVNLEGTIVIKEDKQRSVKSEQPVATTSKQQDVNKIEKAGRELKHKKNVFDYMNLVSGPLSALRTCIDHNIRIKVVTRNMRGIRGHCEGFLVAFDKLWNLALKDVTEVWTRKIKKKVPALGQELTERSKRPSMNPNRIAVQITRLDHKTEQCQRKMPQILLRGEHVVLGVCRQKLRLSNSASDKLDERQKKVLGKGLPKKASIPGVKHTILVCSGKGGVGKSTTAVNLAVSMANLKDKMQIGLLDADVFGPTVPTMMNLHDQPIVTEEKKFLPLENYNVKCMSMGFLVDEKAALVWRGLMVMSALDKLLRQVDWGELDCLVVDTPPGTGDTLLSLMQNIPVSGVLIVTTPQKAALQVARRGATMIQKLGISIAGIVQNMSHVICPKCEHNFSIYQDNTSTLAKDLGVPILSNIPIDPVIASNSDEGIPAVIKDPQSSVAQHYNGLALKMIDYLHELKIDSKEVT